MITRTLEWRPVPMVEGCSEAVTPFGTIWCVMRTESGQYRAWMEAVSWHHNITLIECPSPLPNEEEAKAACQAKYEEMVTQCLVAN